MALQCVCSTQSPVFAAFFVNKVEPSTNYEVRNVTFRRKFQTELVLLLFFSWASWIVSCNFILCITESLQKNLLVHIDLKRAPTHHWNHVSGGDELTSLGFYIESKDLFFIYLFSFLTLAGRFLIQYRKHFQKIMVNFSYSSIMLVSLRRSSWNFQIILNMTFTWECLYFQLSFFFPQSSFLSW